MIFCPDKYKTNFINPNIEFLNLEGDLDDREAQITLAKFLSSNMGFTMDLIAGVNPALYQEIIMKAFMNRNFSMMVGARGAAKSTIASWLSFWIPIFQPNTNILLSGPTFRCARHIFNNLEKIVMSKEATLLRQCFTENPSKRNDEFFWKINNGTIRAIPLSQDRVRGFRASVLILDEFLLLSEDVVKNVLQPFLIAPSDIKRRIEITEREDNLIKHGQLRENERTVFDSNARMIVLTSASFSFEYAYQVYQDWLSKIYNDKEVESAKYFVCNISYQALPEYMVEQSIIEEAKSGEELHPSFKREFMAQFIDGSDSFFSARKMHDLTVKDSERPTTLIKGRPGKSYILSCDPSFSDATNSDYFAFALLEISEENDTVTLVHNYGVPGNGVSGTGLKRHIEYFYYLLTNFNIVLIVPDNADGNFIQSANESALFKNNKLSVDFIDFDSSLEGEEYSAMLREVRKQYNLDSKRICFKKVFNAESIRKMNEQLKTWIDSKKIFFASKLVQHGQDYTESLNYDIQLQFEKGKSIADMISDQDDWIYQVKKQCSLIEIDSSRSSTTQRFDLPQQLRRNTSPTRCRKDNYTCLLLGIEGAKAYWDIMRQAPKEPSKMFIPVSWKI